MDTREPEDEALEAWVARTRPDTATRDAVAESILRVLAAAHRRGAAHPGLTAGHVHVHEDDGTVTASITGFDHPAPTPNTRATRVPVWIAVACVVLALIAWIASCAPSAPPLP